MAKLTPTACTSQLLRAQEALPPTQPTFRSAFARPFTAGRQRTGVFAMASQKLDKSTPEETWRSIMSAEEFRILRKKGTEPAGSGLYNKHKEQGEYACAGCGTVLYTSEQKFDSGCGWPAFYDNKEGTVDRHEDNAFGMKRVEITCVKCGGHLGHVFEGEGFQTPTDERHCVNSTSIKFNG